MLTTVVAVYDNFSDAQQAKNELITSGFPPERVQVTARDVSARDVSASTTGEADESFGSKVRNFFGSLFGGDERHKYAGYYSEAVSRGGAVITVDAANDDEVDRAEDILEHYDPIDIDERNAQWQGQGLTGYDTSSKPAELQDKAQIPVVEEQLKVGKREVQRGGVRVFNRITEKPVEESVQLREERATVERRSVDRPATEADLAAFQEGTIEVRETTEEPVVEKTARVVEEVLVGKEATERTETIRDTVRRTEVDVENLTAQTAPAQTASTYTAASGYGAYEADFRNHAQITYVSSRYDDYEPAYRYGYDLAGDPRYAGHDWEEIEPDVRRDWETRYPDSLWEQKKAAVRYSWEKVHDRR